MFTVIWGIIAILIVFWIIGFAIHIGGAFIHLLLVLAIILILYNLITGRGARI